MSISPMGLHRDLPASGTTGQQRPAPLSGNANGHTGPSQAEAPKARTVTVDLPEPMPGRLQLDVDGETGRVVGRIIDKDSGRLIRQVPTDTALKLAASVKHMFEPLFSARA